ncbi:MAG: NlpC/P60 family protein [Elusimicrobiota bacterium]
MRTVLSLWILASPAFCAITGGPGEDLSPHYVDYILDKNSRGRADKDLLRAVLTAGGSCGGIGAMGVPAQVAARAGRSPEELAWFNSNVEAGAAHLNELLGSEKDLEKALRAYCPGSSGFASRVLSEYRRLKGGTGEPALAARVHASPSFQQLQGSLQSPPSVSAGAVQSPGETIAKVAEKYAYSDMRYRRGREDEDAADCSGFVRFVLSEAGVMDRDVFEYRSAAEQFRASRTGVETKQGYRLRALREDETPRPGDVVYFRRKGRINHAGIFLGYGEGGCLKMAHSSGGGSQVTCSEYHAGRVAGFGRVEKR